MTSILEMKIKEQFNVKKEYGSENCKDLYSNMGSSKKIDLFPFMLSFYGEQAGITEQTLANGQVKYRLKTPVEGVNPENVAGVWISKDEAEKRLNEEMKREIFAKDIKKGYDNLINKDLKKNKFSQYSKIKNIKNINKRKK